MPDTQEATRILIVDDEPYIRKAVRDTLGDEGYVVEEAGDGAQCLEKLKTGGPFDLILMDIQMPGESGMETFRKMARENYGADTIMISGHGTIETAVEALKLGAHDFLEKPFSTARLRNSVKNSLEKRKYQARTAALLSEGSEFNGYRIVRKMAEGAMATVYEAMQMKLEKRVALKVLHPHLTQDDSFRKRFEREAKLQAGLTHPNIAQAFDYGEHRSLIYIAMELVEGDTLKAFLRKESRLPLPVAAAVGLKIIEALDHAHSKNVIHRDLKPSNILISKSGEVKLVDFGISKCIENETAEITQADQMVGTPLYLAPEQVEGKPAGKASDLFSFGTLLYLTCTLQYPFSGASMASILRSISECRPENPIHHERTLSPELAALIMRCLQKDPALRFVSAAELRTALENCPEMTGAGSVNRSLRLHFSEKAG